ncbi:MarR family winged helix-turn-helix transcriptional regulator [Mycolicibacterium komossense]|uniref:MarR family transcriptional regulator n=1 Tax=Mycolicibacterium komossense TaxID=1779 RepID=A0ABT3CEL2_9MYCO|nr:MarR family transcriptional regulator [Mycolicibacterium komossense]MCV7227919.1 MarR family transcriptional regulator [Mycolicibacterium komossense]
MATELSRIAGVLKRRLESFHGSIDDLAHELVRVLGVNRTDLRALLLILIAGEKATTPGFLADQLGLTAAGTTIVLNRLEKIGYVTRSLHPTDHRRVIVLATDLAAHRFSELVSPLLDQGLKMLVSYYNAAEISLIAGFLARSDELQQAHLNRMRELDPFPN